MITTAVQKGDYVYVYNERQATIANVYGKLVGYTGSTYSIKKSDGYIYTYNE